jgi:hypothetical protein
VCICVRACVFECAHELEGRGACELRPVLGTVFDNEKVHICVCVCECAHERKGRDACELVPCLGYCSPIRRWVSEFLCVHALMRVKA